jgi:hypothetical protein
MNLGFRKRILEDTFSSSCTQFTSDGICQLLHVYIRSVKKLFFNGGRVPLEYAGGLSCSFC